MPYKKAYTQKNVKTGNTRTPASVMGSQGHPAPLKLDHFHNRATGSTPFPGKAASKAKKNY